MAQTSDELWNSLEPAAFALQRDGEAIADPTKASADEMALGELLADILGYEPKRCAQHARGLLVECGNDYVGLRRMIVAARERGELLWVQEHSFRVYGLVKVLADEYRAQQQIEERRAFENTTEGRRAKYASYPGVTT